MGALLMHRPKRLLKTHHAVSSPCTARRHCTTELSVPSELNAFSLFMHARSSTASALSLCSMHRPKRLHAAQHAVSAPCTVRKHCATELSVLYTQLSMRSLFHAPSKCVARPSPACPLNCANADTQRLTTKSELLEVAVSGVSAFVSAAFPGVPLVFGCICPRICALSGCICPRIWSLQMLHI
jgi:hypothetical protein